MLKCALALWLQHRLRHLLHEQGNAVGALDDVLADVGWQRLVANNALDHGENFALSKPIDSESGYMRPSDPRRLELWPERYEQQYTKATNPVHDAAKQFQGRGVGPMRILEDHQHRTLACQCLYL